MVGVAARGHLGEAGFWIYPLQTIGAAILLFSFRKHYSELKFKWDWAAVVVGLVVFILWVALDPYLPHFERKNVRAIDSALLIVFRLAGSSLVVPIIEELFWRSFLMRWVIDPSWQKVPLGKFSWSSFLIVAVIFGFEHGEYASGFIAGLIYAGLLYWRKNLFSCVLAHGVTNLLLGLYVIKTQSWQFW
jgi:uncharacterized protein